MADSWWILFFIEVICIISKYAEITWVGSGSGTL